MQEKRLEFRGGLLVALIPFLLFIVFCIIFFVVLQYYEMIALALGAIVSLIIGSLFSKKWSDY